MADKFCVMETLFEERNKERELLQANWIKEDVTAQLILPVLQALGPVAALLPEEYDHAQLYFGAWSAEKDKSFFKRGYINLFFKGIKTWAAIIPVLEAVDAMGAEPPEDGFFMREWETEDDAESYTRIFTRDLYIDEVELRVRIHAVLPGDTDSCKRMLVGYEKPFVGEPKPVYKMVCEDGATTSPEA